MHACVLSSFSRVRLFATPWTAPGQAPLSMGFFSQESWSGLPCPPPGDLPSPGVKPASVASPALAGKFFTTLGSPALAIPPVKPKQPHKGLQSLGVLQTVEEMFLSWSKSPQHIRDINYATL